MVRDTDDDGLDDGVEVNRGYDPTDGNSPQVLRGIRFSGADGAYLEFPKQRRFALRDWSIELWMQPAKAQVVDGSRILLERQVGSYTTGRGTADELTRKLVNYGLRINQNGTVSAYYTDARGIEVAATSLTPATMDNKTWTHIAATYNGANRELTSIGRRLGSAEDRCGCANLHQLGRDYGACWSRLYRRVG